MAAYILAHDLGTSGNKASLMDREGNLVHSVTINYGTDYQSDNRVEQNPDDWWKAVKEATSALLQKVSAGDIGAVSFSGQMMGCLLVDDKGVPLHPSLIWADQRSTKQIRALGEKISPERIYSITGHRLSESYSINKYMWLRENKPELVRGRHKILNAKDYIVFKLTGEYCTDYSDAAGLNAFDIMNYQWSDEILDAAGVDRAVLPRPIESTAVAGEVTGRAAEETGLRKGTPVVMGAGDGIAATVGAGCLEPGDCYNYIGSSSWIATAADAPLFDKEQRTFTWPHITKGLYSPCGTTQCAGGSVSWMKRELADVDGHDVSYDRINELIASSIPGAHGILFLPYLMGERSPLWDPKARGAFIGLAMEHKRADIFRSVMEGVSLNLGLIFDCLVDEEKIKEVTLIGGGAQSPFWNQILADIFGRPVKIPRELEEATSLGAAAMGALGIGMVKNAKELNPALPLERVVNPNPGNYTVYAELKERMLTAYHQLKPLFPEE